MRFCEQLATVIPNAHVYYRRGLALKRIIPQCIARNFTYLIVINEDRKVPSILKGSCFRRGMDDTQCSILLSVIYYIAVIGVMTEGCDTFLLSFESHQLQRPLLLDESSVMYMKVAIRI